MYSRKMRFIICCLGITFSIFSYFKNDYFGSVIILVGVSFLIYGYFRYGEISLAFKNIQKQNYSKAKTNLARTFSYDLLSKQFKGFYHMVYGLCELNENNFEEAKEQLIEALNFNLRTENNKSMINLALSEIYYQQNELEKARVYLEKAKNLDHKEEIDIQIKEFEKAISN